MTGHAFGGSWTEIKLSILRNYLSFYTTALKNQPFELIYIDAFAGTGERQQKRKSAPLLGEEEIIQTLDGSVRIALDTPGFSAYHFIEQDPKRFAHLKTVIQEEKYQAKNIYSYQDDANQCLCHIINKHITSNHIRAVLFLDPYGLELEWKTLEAINKTQKIDVWFLFSLSGLYRNACIDYDKMENYKKVKISKIFGTDEWEKIFYTTDYQPPQGDFFGETFSANKPKRTASIQELENYTHQRLSSLFAHVETPITLPKIGTGKAPMYSLFLCVSNPAKPAVALAGKVAKEIIKKH